MSWKHLIAAWMLMLACSLNGQALGSPLITNFEPEVYKAHLQNLSVAQDGRGVLFFGNATGVLEYDGQRWDLTVLPNNTIARSLAAAQDGTIFWGAVGDFGFLAAGPTGKTIAISLREGIPEADRAFNDVWQTIATPQGMVFLTRNRVFRFFQGQVHSIPARFALGQACVLDGSLFFIEMDRGLCVLDGDQVVQLPFSDKVFNHKRICLAPFGPHQLLAARAGENFQVCDLTSFWNEDSQKYDWSRPVPKEAVRPFPCDFAELASDKALFLYKLRRLSENTFALCTLKGGILLFDRQGRALRRINTQNGLLDDTVAEVFLDAAKNLWAATNSGISHIEFSTPQSYFGPRNGLRGISMSTIRHKGRFYVGTYQDLFSLQPFDPVKDTHPVFKSLKNAPNEVWEFMETSAGDLLAATSAGLVKVQGEEVIRLAPSIGNAYCLAQSHRFPDHLFLGLMEGLELFRKSGSTWTPAKRYPEIKDNLRSLAVDGRGDLWAATDGKGILRIQFPDNNPERIVFQRFGTEHGLPNLEAMVVCANHGQLYVLTSKGIYLPASTKASPNGTVHFSPETTFGKRFVDPPTDVKGAVFEEDGTVWVNTENGVMRLDRQADGAYRADPAPFKGLPLPDSRFSRDSSGVVWLPGKLLFQVDASKAKDTTSTFQALIRRVEAKGRLLLEGSYGREGSLPGHHRSIFVAEQNGEAPLLPFAQNALRFDFTATFFEKPGTTEFQYLLEGFDQAWSPWSREVRKEYTNLPEGSYRFRVKARNLYRVESREATFTFRIRPPWYRTWWAYILWVVGGGGAVIGVIRLYTLKLRRQKLLLEQLVAKRTQQLKDASLTDPLTGLRNRRFITEILQTDIAAFVGYKAHLIVSENHRDSGLENKVFGLVMLDIDFFKKVNDTYGHEAGDRVLKQFSDILKKSVRLDDAIMRLGGEEFLVVLKKTDPAYLSVFAEKILDRVRSFPFDLGEGVTIQKTCSLGFASFPFFPSQPKLLSFEQCIQIVDLGLYYAKNHGRDQAVALGPGGASPSTDTEVQHMVTDLEYALKQDFLRLGGE